MGNARVRPLYENRYIAPGAFRVSAIRFISSQPLAISQIIAGKRSVTGDTALRFGHWFGVEPQFWMNLQAQFDLAVAERRVGNSVRELPTVAQI